MNIIVDDDDDDQARRVMNTDSIKRETDYDECDECKEES